MGHLYNPVSYVSKPASRKEAEHFSEAERLILLSKEFISSPRGKKAKLSESRSPLFWVSCPPWDPLPLGALMSLDATLPCSQHGVGGVGVQLREGGWCMEGSNHSHMPAHVWGSIAGPHFIPLQSTQGYREVRRTEIHRKSTPALEQMSSLQQSFGLQPRCFCSPGTSGKIWRHSWVSRLGGWGVATR